MKNKFYPLLILLCIFCTNVQSAVHNVYSGNYYYTDANTGTSSSVVNIGDTVVWLRDAGFHNVNFDINTITGVSFGNPVSFISVPTNSDTIYHYVFTVPGYYQYDCSVGSHAVNGMVGDIIVNSSSNSIYDIVSNSTDHTTLKTAIDACALDATLSGPGPFTLFAPTDAAFNLLPSGTLTALLNDIPQLTDILLHHVVGDSVMSTMLSNNQIVTTLLGTNITVTINTNGVFIDNAQVTVADLIADNGVVHVIDAVLLPPDPSLTENLNNNDNTYLYTINSLGSKVDRYLKSQIIFDVYKNGKIIRRFNP